MIFVLRIWGASINSRTLVPLVEEPSLSISILLAFYLKHPYFERFG